jgi:sirohydrochlorin cobaltochelatase
VILARAADAGADLQAAAGGAVTADAERTFLEWLEAARPAATADPGGTDADARIRRWGELTLRVQGPATNRRYAVHHREDADAARDELDSLASPAAVRERARTTEAGTYRPQAFARTLPRGWRFETTDPGALVRSIRAVYPASIDHWYGDRTGRVESTGFEAVVARQAGRYRDLDALEATTRTAAIEACCGDCVRRPDWTDEPAVADGSFPCPEPCSFLLEAARSFDEPAAAAPAATPDPTVPAARFDDPANRYRVRYERAVHADHSVPDGPLPDP